MNDRNEDPEKEDQYPQGHGIEPAPLNSSRSNANLTYKARAKLEGMNYTVTDIPPLHITLLLGCQQWLTMIGATVLQPLILIPAMGGSPEQTAKAISTIFVVCGINTLLQTTVGDRLPIVQGGSFSYLPPVFSIIFNSKLQSIQDNNERFEETLATVGGAIFVVGIVQAFIGYTGLVVPMLRFISPVTIAPVIAIIGLSLYHLGFADISSCWSIGLIQIALATIFSQYLKRVMVFGYPIFCLFPVLLAACLTWAFAAILTAAEVYDEGSKCRTDGARDLVASVPFLVLPYPGQFGLRFESWAIVPMLGGMFAGMLESVGDYYSCAKLSGAPPPTPGIISRGLGCEGIGVMLAGLFGTGTGTTSYSENIAAIAISRVGSRVVVQTGALFMIAVGLLHKVSALVAAWPQALVGGIYCVLFGLIIAVGLSNLQYVNLNSDRNLFIIGFSIYNALSIAGPSGYMTKQPENPFGSSNLAAIAYSLFSSPMIIALVCAVFLDNTIPGTPRERGLHAWAKVRNADVNNDPEYVKVYSLPGFLAKLFHNCSYLEYPSLGHFPPRPEQDYKAGSTDLLVLCCACLTGKRDSTENEEPGVGGNVVEATDTKGDDQAVVVF